LRSRWRRGEGPGSRAVDSEIVEFPSPGKTLRKRGETGAFLEVWIRWEKRNINAAARHGHRANGGVSTASGEGRLAKKPRET